MRRVVVSTEDVSLVNISSDAHLVPVSHLSDFHSLVHPAPLIHLRIALVCLVVA